MNTIGILELSLSGGLLILAVILLRALALDRLEEEEAPAHQNPRQPDRLPEGDCGRAGDRLCLCAGQDREDSDSRPRRRRHRGRRRRRRTSWWASSSTAARTSSLPPCWGGKSCRRNRLPG